MNLSKLKLSTLEPRAIVSTAPEPISTQQQPSFSSLPMSEADGTITTSAQIQNTSPSYPTAKLDFLAPGARIGLFTENTTACAGVRGALAGLGESAAPTERAPLLGADEGVEEHTLPSTPEKTAREIQPPVEGEGLDFVYSSGAVFTGDHLFVGGMGAIFEGSREG